MTGIKKHTVATLAAVVLTLSIAAAETLSGPICVSSYRLEHHQSITNQFFQLVHFLVNFGSFYLTA